MSTDVTDNRMAWEDFEIGMEIPLGVKPISAQEIMQFAGEFDPQPMHLDEIAGTESLLGGLATSGWHLCCILMRMMCDAYLTNSTSQGAPGVDYVNWKRPVLAGDRLDGTTTVLNRRKSNSRPGIGLVTFEHRLKNQRGEIVAELRNTGMFRLRGAVA